MQNKKQQFIEECNEKIIESNNFDPQNIDKICKQHKFYNDFDIDTLDDCIRIIEQDVIEISRN